MKVRMNLTGFLSFEVRMCSPASELDRLACGVRRWANALIPSSLSVEKNEVLCRFETYLNEEEELKAMVPHLTMARVSGVTAPGTKPRIDSSIAAWKGGRKEERGAPRTDVVHKKNKRLRDLHLLDSHCLHAKVCDRTHACPRTLDQGERTTGLLRWRWRVSPGAVPSDGAVYVREKWYGDRRRTKGRLCTNDGRLTRSTNQSSSGRMVPEDKTVLHLAATEFRAGLEKRCPSPLVAAALAGAPCISTPGEDGDEGAWSLGIPWSEAKFMEVATTVGHPFDGSRDVPDDVTRTISVMVTWGVV